MMSQGSNIDLSEVWLSDEEYNKKIEYLAYAYERIDSELFSSFDLLPLRENNLETSSMFFADICLRLYPLLTIGFNSITFGHTMRANVDYWIIPKQEDKSLDYIKKINIEKITHIILCLREKNRNNQDGIRDYLKFYRYTEWGIDKHFDINRIIHPIYHVGRIEYDDPIKPFDEVFDKYLNTRNSIEHRGMVEATQKEAYYACSALYLLLDKLNSRSSLDFESKIFGGQIEQLTEDYRRSLRH